MKKILIVDDEPHITKALSRELGQWCSENNIEVITSNNSNEVKEMIREDPCIFLLITDMMMPGQSGSELSAAVKTINPQLIIFIMTGYSHIDLVVQAVNSGISSLIIKPWNIELLILELNSALEKQLLKEKESEQRKIIEEELKWGGELQKQLLKREFPQTSDITLSIHYEPLPSLYCGGDYYDVIPVSKKQFFIICADVSGHGIKAAFITTILKSIIFSGYINIHKKDIHPSHFLQWLNSQLLKELKNCPDIIITASVVLLDLNKSTLVYSNAGHTPIYIKRKNSVHEIHLDGTALNFSEEVEFSESRIAVSEGDNIFFFTDGLLEIGENSQMLKSKEIKNLIMKTGTDETSALNLVDSFRRMSDSNNFNDDVTAIIVGIK